MSAATRSIENVSAWDLVRRGMWHFHQVTRPTHLQARELFHQAITLDPQLPEAHAWLARVDAGLGPYFWSDDPAGDLREGLAAALKAVQLDEKNPYSHYALAVTSVFSGAFEQAMRAAEKSIEIGPSFALGHLVLGMARLFAGAAEKAIEPLEHGLRLSPYDPQSFLWFRMLALAYHFTGHADRALQAALKALKVRPSWVPTLETVALCYVALDRVEEARKLIEDMRQLEEPTADILAQLRKNNPHWADAMASMLAKAAAPE